MKNITLTMTVVLISTCALSNIANATEWVSEAEAKQGKYVLPAPGRKNMRIKEYAAQKDSKVAEARSRGEFSRAGFYVGGEIGYLMADWGDLQPGNVAADDFLAEDYVSGAFYAGYSFTPRLAAELSYFSTTDENQKNVPNDASNDIQIDGVSLDGVYTHPLNGYAALLGSLGVGYYTQHAGTNDIAGTIPTSFTDEDFAIRAGVGGEYALNDNWSTRLMVRYSDVDFENTDNDSLWNIGVGVNYRF